MKNISSIIATTLIALSALSTAGADETPANTETVRFADLDPTQPAGAAALYRRIEHAAIWVCRDVNPARSLSLAQAHAQCIRSALTDAIAVVNRPAVTVYAQLHGLLRDSGASRLARN